jgi:hypothetical protein
MMAQGVEPVKRRKKACPKPDRPGMVGILIRYNRKLQRIPAQIAEPMTPEELQAMACMSR